MSGRDTACNGCTICSMRCTDGIRISELEFDRMLETLRDRDRAFARRVLDQPQELPWFEGITYRACRFLDQETRLCLIYEARPLICRLFGHVRHLPCPAERVPADLDAAHLMSAYTAQPLRTFQQWMALRGLFSFDALLGEGEGAAGA
jgi:Fe-S-cluster containining protein